jgi:hypothetical protein
MASEPFGRSVVNKLLDARNKKRRSFCGSAFQMFMPANAGTWLTLVMMMVVMVMCGRLSHRECADTEGQEQYPGNVP